jgi:hypothetical protein
LVPILFGGQIDKVVLVALSANSRDCGLGVAYERLGLGSQEVGSLDSNLRQRLLP